MQPARMTAIFISYRQDDSKAWAIALRDELARAFGDAQVFLDKDTLKAGRWRAQIDQALRESRVVLVLIGPRWLGSGDAQGQPRLQRPDDVHRQEVAQSLARPAVTVIPVLVDEAPMPAAADLPADLRDLCNRQARKIGDTRSRRQADLDLLITDIVVATGLERRPAGTTGAGLLRRALLGLALAFVATVALGVVAYVAGYPLVDADLALVWLLLFLGSQAWAWRRRWARRPRNGQG